jgi:outer membrane lipoprotein-sorting protein
MVYEDPFQYLLVVNNNDVWIRDGQSDSHISANSNKLFQQLNKLIVDCVKGTALSSPDFSNRVFENADDYLVELIPASKTLRAIFKNINIVLDKKDFSVSEIQMFELSGDSTVIRFFAKEFNVNIPDALFAVH